MMLSQKQITKALINLHGCAGWSAPLLFASPRRHVFSRQVLYMGLPMLSLLSYKFRYKVLRSIVRSLIITSNLSMPLRSLTMNVFSLKIVFFLANTADPNYMQLSATFLLGLYCLPKCPLWGWLNKANKKGVFRVKGLNILGRVGTSIFFFAKKAFLNA